MDEKEHHKPKYEGGDWGFNNDKIYLNPNKSISSLIDVNSLAYSIYSWLKLSFFEIASKIGYWFGSAGICFGVKFISLLTCENSSK